MFPDRLHVRIRRTRSVQPHLPYAETDLTDMCTIAPLHTQLLKWIGNKQRFAPEIVAAFPRQFATYREPFLGSGAVLASLAPDKGVGSDVFKPLIEIWQALKADPELPVGWYEERWKQSQRDGKDVGYEAVKASYNRFPNGPDLLYLCRTCYGGVVRFRKTDGYMSTPCGPHKPVSPTAFRKRAQEWHRRLRHVDFVLADYQQAMAAAKPGDLIYCDPPYVDTQAILYGAQSFSIRRLLEVITDCKNRGVYVALSIDGTKRSGEKICDVPIPGGLFESDVSINCGRSMLRRFQMHGQTLEREVVADRLLLTYTPGAD